MDHTSAAPALSEGLLTTPYRDPRFDGATDPVLVQDGENGRWLMFYTQRRASEAHLRGVEWVHGSEIGVAESSDGGETWSYAGTPALDAPGLEQPVTRWAPDVVNIAGRWYMFLTLLGGLHEEWTGSAVIAQYTSTDLVSWEFQAYLDLGSDRVIDAAVARCGDGLYRLWFKDERQGSRTFAATTTTPELPGSWRLEGLAIDGRAHEGPKVFELGGWYWMITDEWRGLAVHRSRDGAGGWQRQGRDDSLILTSPEVFGGHPVGARHADVVVQGPQAAVVYFTHPEWSGSDLDTAGPSIAHRRTHIRAAWFQVSDGEFVPARTQEPTVPAPQG